MKGIDRAATAQRLLNGTRKCRTRFERSVSHRHTHRYEPGILEAIERAGLAFRARNNGTMNDYVYRAIVEKYERDTGKRYIVGEKPGGEPVGDRPGPGTVVLK